MLKIITWVYTSSIAFYYILLAFIQTSELFIVKQILEWIFFWGKADNLCVFALCDLITVFPVSVQTMTTSSLHYYKTD